MRRWLGLLAFLTGACGGAAQSDVLGEPSPGTTPTQSTTPPAGTPPPAGTGTTPSATPPPPPGSCTTTYYRDTDGDGFGGRVTQVACKSPGDGWVTTGGDCADDDDNVFPGQTAYFAVPYSLGGGLHSFDYNCNAKEEEKAPLRKIASANCSFVGNTCAGSGYVALSRTGAGTDPLCGATQYQTCALKNLGTPSCEATIATVETVTCH